MRFIKSQKVSTKSVESALSAVSDPVSGMSIHESGRIDSLMVSPSGDIVLTLKTTAERREADEKLRYEIEQTLSAVKKVGKVSVILTAHSDQPSRPAPATGQHRVMKGDGLASEGAKPAVAPAQAATVLNPPGIRNVVAISSAKGGVGKSTLTINLAVALAQQGLRVGVLDADVYGPSVPTMTGTVEADPKANPQGKLIPIEAFGLKLMSIGYVSDIDAPMVWRGPVVMSALSQMLKDVDWGELDILLIDTPPGTGDIQLTLAQRVQLSGAVIVSTPQEVALADVRRGAAMFRKTNVPVLGIVENMAWFEDPLSGNRSYLFGEGGARKLADALEVPFLGEVPIAQPIREGGDGGVPVAVNDERLSGVYSGIADRVMSELSRINLPAAPEIIFE